MSNTNNTVRSTDSFDAGDCKIKRSNDKWLVFHLGDCLGECETYEEAETLASDTTASLLSDECDALSADAERNAELASAMYTAIHADDDSDFDKDELADQAAWGNDKYVPFVYED